MKFDPLTFGMETNTLTIKPPICYDNMLHYILFIEYFILNIIKM
jgi:hypothetical protein